MSSYLRSYDHGAVNEQIANRVSRLRDTGWLVCAGLDALEIIRKHCAFRGPQKPKLWIHCEHNVGTAERVYEDFVPRVIAIQNGIVEIHGDKGSSGHRQTLYFDPMRLAHESGRFVSYVAAQSGLQALWKEIAAVELSTIR